MDRPDPSLIISKYRKLFGINKADKKSSSEPIRPKKTQSNANVKDAWLDPEHFIREPVEAVSQSVDESDVGYENIMFNSLFAAAEENHLDPCSHANREEFFKQNVMRLDILAASLTLRI
jgi:hypothetical protein